MRPIRILLARAASLAALLLACLAAMFMPSMYDGQGKEIE